MFQHVLGMVRCPPVWKQSFQIRLACAQVEQDVPNIRPRFQAMTLGSRQNGEQHRRPWSRLGTSQELPVLPSNGLESHRPLRDIVIDRQPAVAHVLPQRSPLVPSVGHRFSQGRLGQGSARQVIQIALDPIQHRHRLQLAQCLTLGGREIQRPVFDIVKLLNPLEDLIGLARRILPRVIELPTRVRPTRATSTIPPSEPTKIPS